MREQKSSIISKNKEKILNYFFAPYQVATDSLYYSCFDSNDKATNVL